MQPPPAPSPVEPARSPARPGNLTFTGVENLETGAFTETITGTVCKSGDDD